MFGVRTNGYSDAVNGAPAPRPTEFVQSLERGLSVIRAFSAEHPRLTLSQVADITGMTRAAARRFLITLESLGYVASDGRFFSLRPSVLQLGYAYLSSFTLAEIAQEHLGALAEELHESCSGSVLDGEDIVYIARASTNRIMTIGISVGARLPAYCTSMGRVLLADFDEYEREKYLATADLQARTNRTITDVGTLHAELQVVAEQGWCLLDQELEDGIRSIAVPVHDATRTVVAAINVSTHASRVQLPDLIAKYLPRLQACSARIDADLAGRKL